ncbi:uncharacterized protein EHS24_005796 [Apiotrichum porosum]|uniref:Uncharacterized protein n=1 Tax=Apiotrichum porosum TaxID=105984 RepID=A0A427XZM1_9TREE|nr:uncharacterized protein EHS24_005796 [Apiotrichum porosum]RSH84281.1 hypothetical protein EHS24_005796 [Apiotrichum porosum]
MGGQPKVRWCAERLNQSEPALSYQRSAQESPPHTGRSSMQSTLRPGVLCSPAHNGGSSSNTSISINQQWAAARTTLTLRRSGPLVVGVLNDGCEQSRASGLSASARELERERQR